MSSEASNTRLPSQSPDPRSETPERSGPPGGAEDHSDADGTVEITVTRGSEERRVDIHRGNEYSGRSRRYGKRQCKNCPRKIPDHAAHCICVYKEMRKRNQALKAAAKPAGRGRPGPGGSGIRRPDERRKLGKEKVQKTSASNEDNQPSTSGNYERVEFEGGKMTVFFKP